MQRDERDESGAASAAYRRCWPCTGEMMRRAFRMQLKPGAVDEYRRRHDRIWPELAKAIGDAGIHDYSIFLDERDLSLFAVLRIDNTKRQEDLADQPVMRKWWDYMADLMDVLNDNRPVETPLVSVFHLD